MLGLIKKDFLIIKANLKSMVITFIVYLMLAFQGTFDVKYISSIILTVVLGIIALAIGIGISYIKTNAINLNEIISSLMGTALSSITIISLLYPIVFKFGATNGKIILFAVVFGKMLGGIIGDKIGFTKISLISLIVSAFLFIFAFNNSILGILAILFFNMTMPITLTALSNILFNNKGMAFGLLTLELFIGAIPVFFGYLILWDYLLQQ